MDNCCCDPADEDEGDIAASLRNENMCSGDIERPAFRFRWDRHVAQNLDAVAIVRHLVEVPWQYNIVRFGQTFVELSNLHCA